MKQRIFEPSTRSPTASVSTLQVVLASLLGAISLAYIVHHIYISASISSPIILGRDEIEFNVLSSISLLQAETWREKIDALFQTHGQHILLGMQSANALSLWLFDTISFRFLNGLGTVYLVIAAFCLILKFKPTLVEFLLLCAVTIPISLSAEHVSCSINASCTGNHYLGISLAIIALFLLTKKNSAISFLIGEVFTILAVFTLPSTLPLLGLIFPLIYFVEDKRRLTYITFHCVILLIVIFCFYIITYPLSSDPSNIESMRDILKVLLLIGLLFTNTVGSFLYWPNDIVTAIPCILLGIAVTLYGLTIVKKTLTEGANEQDLFYLFGFLLMLGMIALISLGRYFTYGSPRYSVYSVFTLLFFIYMLINYYYLRKHLLSFAIAATLLYPIEYRLNRSYIQKMQTKLNHCEKKWQTQQKICGVMVTHDYATNVFVHAMEVGIIENNLEKITSTD